MGLNDGLKRKVRFSFLFLVVVKLPCCRWYYSSLSSARVGGFADT